jgi:hypothetical protein
MRPRGLLASAAGRPVTSATDLDRLNDRILIEALALRSGQSPDRIVRATVQRYQGILFGGDLTHSRLNGIRSTTVGHQLCPRCLAERDVPYLRLVWRLSFVCMCAEHVRALLDRCPGCGWALRPKRPQRGTGAWKIDPTGLALCGWCGMDLRSAEPPKLPYGIGGPALAGQKKLLSALKWGPDFLAPYRDHAPGEYIQEACRALRSAAKLLQREGLPGTMQRSESVAVRAMALASLTFD